MSNTWPELIDKLNALNEATKDINILNLLFSRTTLCHANREVLATNSDLDFRVSAMSGHSITDALEDNSSVEVMLSLVDMAELENAQPTVGNNSAFYIDTKYIHHVPWGFDVIRRHVGVIAKSVFANPAETIPIQDILKFETLMRRFIKMTVNFRVHMDATTNLQHQFLLATKQNLTDTVDQAIRKQIEQDVHNQCEIFKQLMHVGKTRIAMTQNTNTTLDESISTLSKINRTLRWR